jgi:hypothetical protein
MSRVSSAAVRYLCTAAFLMSLGTVGCGRSNGRGLSVDPELAKQSFDAFLAAWKQGKSQSELKSLSPSIISGDEDWSAGSKLVGYKVSDRVFNDGANLHLTAELQLAGAKKKKPGRTSITYVVGTSPVITIFRK